MPDVSLRYIANLEELKAALQQIPGLTKKEADEMARRMDAASKRMAASVKKAGSQADKDWQKSMGDVRRGSEKVFGGIVGDVLDVKDGLLAIGPAAGPMLAIFGGAAVAAVSATTAVVGLVAAGDDAARALRDVGGAAGDLISDEQLDALEGANAAMATLSTLASALTAELGAEFAPVVEDVALVLVELGLRTLDAVKDFNRMHDTLTEIAVFLTGVFVDAVLSPFAALSLVADQILKTGVVSGKAATMLQNYSDGYNTAKGAAQGFVREQIQSADLTLTISDRTKDLVANVRAYNAVRSESTERDQDAARALIEFDQDMKSARENFAQQASILAELRDGASAYARAHTDAGALVRQDLDAELTRLQDIQERWQNIPSIVQAAKTAEVNAQKEAAEKLDAINAESSENYVKAQTAANDAVEAARQATLSHFVEMGQTITDYTQGAASAVSSLADAWVANAREGSKAQKNAAMVGYVATQAEAVAGATMAGYEAAVKGIAAYGPTPAGFAAATAAGLFAAAQVGAILATPAPDVHHDGGYVGAGNVGGRGPLAPDERLIRARVGEKVLTRQEQTSQQPVMVQSTQVYNHRSFDTFVADNLRLQGSPLSKAIRGKQPPVGWRK